MNLTLYFGGYHFPFEDMLPVSPNVLALIGSVVFFIKISFFGFVFMWIRWTLPRFRYDQLMKLGWYFFFELALANIFIAAWFAN